MAAATGPIIVIVKAVLRVAAVRINPRDAKDRVPLFNKIADIGVFELQVENVVFVDPWRNDQERRLVNRLGQWRILDKLD